jgi:hypothetical protein
MPFIEYCASVPAIPGGPISASSVSTAKTTWTTVETQLVPTVVSGLYGDQIAFTEALSSTVIRYDPRTTSSSPGLNATVPTTPPRPTGMYFS